MKKILSLVVLIVFLIGCHSAFKIPEPKVTPNLTFIPRPITVLGPVTDKVSLVLSYHVDENNINGMVSLLYLFHKETKKYKVLLKQLNICTKNEAFVLYHKDKTMVIGRSGKLELRYSENAKGDRLLIVEHYKYNKKTKKKGKLKAEYTFNLTKMANEL